MIEYKNSKLNLNDLIIESADTLIRLQSDIECNLVGVVHLTNGVTKTLPFTKTGSYHLARLIITEEDYEHFSNPKFSLIVIDGNTHKQTCIENLNINLAKIKLDIKLKISKEIQDLTIKVNQVSKTLNDLLQKGTINGINILGYEYVKPGMVPIAIDDKGNCMFQYPLANIISELNGLKTADGTLRLEAKDIPSGRTDVETRLNTIVDSIKTMGSHIQNLADSVKELSGKIGELDIRLSSHLDTSIV
jgi:uncharacterized protein YoxC